MLVGCSAHAAVYEFDDGESELTVWVPRAGLLRMVGHDHTIEVQKFSGYLLWNEGDVQDSQLFMEVTSASLKIADKGVTEKQRNDIQEEMEGEAVLQVAAYPDIRFESSGIIVADPGKWEVHGSLTIRDVTQKFSFDVAVDFHTAELLVAVGVALLKPSEFGIPPVRALGGLVRTSDQIELRFRIQGQRSKVNP